MIGVIIYTSGVTERHDFGPDGEPQYAMMRKIIDGYFEVTPGPFNCHIWTNEDGKRLKLPINRFATNAFKRWLAPYDYIVGDVIVTGPADQQGESTDIDEMLEKFLLQGFATLRPE